ncbi:hypothetical protein PV10_01720 [Exophiala mesophila]|uniref:Uncharacterized protein n=1 Tax=Exophiala mesophila TaxID=212818 RepID=A0A0D1ZU26_EXOME|nr:uncharacterized protein PV10_01720 [Exophiala mesophila]KIV98027.1 hypothetical protein PV10_01720 [Exophiala mesophila]
MASTSSPYSDSTLYLYTSLTAGSSHIITATSRMETILKANKIPFRAVDCATDEKARMLWGRRSKGRKLPGLVKFGSIIGDLEQIEEWNEYGELKEQIAEADEFGSLGSSTANATLAPEPPISTTNASTPQRSGPPSRASSETRHISIAEPSKDKEATKPAESSLNQTIRQLGAEAAAKAGQKKAAATAAAVTSASSSTTTPTTAAKVPTKSPSTTDQIPVPAATKLSADAAVDSGEGVAAVTAAKIPSQLAAEGAKRTSVDKIAETENTTTTTSDPSLKSPTDETTPSTSTSTSTPTSTEEQLLNLRRSSSVTKTKTKLSESTPAAESNTILATSSDSITDTTTETATAEPTKSPSSSASPPAVGPGSSPTTSLSPPPRKHRGSDVVDADVEEIRAMEKKLSIQEEDEEEDEEDEKEKAKAKAKADLQGEESEAKITATDKLEDSVTTKGER